ncbi:D-2-hydroxyacid dehydrogenase [Bacillus salacetis]|uniref:D-2-hydroxyacid dehydrogenase n=1 Tax=Bacillus salacetis TaxID=2315464 RepID=A0A3A1QVH6_9BACI|nr:D-2-hydroxyacid dehydrogenase [Bacillus salacetis]RIW32344.1 D-2-hydroxyacid dehydrogenase [Bacillus salacetis]
MKILFTFQPPEEMKMKWAAAFPACDFQFYEGIQSAGKSLAEAEVIVTYGEDLNEEHILKAEQLRWVMVMSAGLELMPLKMLKEKEILITNVKGIHAIPMAEFVLGLMLQYAKQFPRIMKDIDQGIWHREIPGLELAGQALLILGAGAIGSEIARLGKAFRMNVLGINTSGRKAENFDSMYQMDNLEGALGEADYVISVLPSTDYTRGLLGKEHFQCMKTSAVFINIGRGDLFKSTVLVEALENNEIAHAFLDVFETEPLESVHPYWNMEKVTITPHLSSRTKEYLPRSAAIFEENLKSYMNNGVNYINEIDLERGY